MNRECPKCFNRYITLSRAKHRRSIATCKVCNHVWVENLVNNRDEMSDEEYASAWVDSDGDDSLYPNRNR